ncbi:hypothetical protein GGI43DRAFT_432423 [Trichoderma evansii]
MVFHSPSWVPSMPIDPPDSISIAEFMSDDSYGRYPMATTRNPFTCGLTGKTFTALEVVERELYLARAISKRLNLDYDSSEWERVMAIFSLNTIDYAPVTHAIHRLSGIVTPVNPAASALELEYQLRSSHAIALFTCNALAKTALQAAKAVGIAIDRIFILPMADDRQDSELATIEDLVLEGRTLSDLGVKKWSRGQGARQVAYLCFSSGTSGLPKAVMVSHYNIIANIIQLSTYESSYRKQQGIDSQTLLGLLPFSHAYGLVVMAHVAPYRGDEVIVLPKYKLETLLTTVQRFKIEQINIAPPILVQMVSNYDKCKLYDLSSIRFIYTGGAPLASETMESLSAQYPKWHIGQIYGMTETAVCVTSTSETDMVPGSAGSLLPGIKAKIVDIHGKEVTNYDTPGELLVQGPAVTLGYQHNDAATADTFIWDHQGRWIRTGDEAVVRLSPNGYEHLFIIDRIKELIKGLQVAPAELEAHLLTHPYVSDCAVIQVPDTHSGEVPKAFVVKSQEANQKADTEVAKAIREDVKNHKAHYKWLAGGVEFIEVIPKSPTGKILRRVLRDKEKKSRKAVEPNL